MREVPNMTPWQNNNRYLYVSWCRVYNKRSILESNSSIFSQIYVRKSQTKNNYENYRKGYIFKNLNSCWVKFCNYFIQSFKNDEGMAMYDAVLSKFRIRGDITHWQIHTFYSVKSECISECPWWEIIAGQCIKTLNTVISGTGTLLAISRNPGT